LHEDAHCARVPDVALYKVGLRRIGIRFRREIIKNGDDVVGLLNMGSRETMSYSRTSLENIATIGLQLGLALDRSKLALALSPDKHLIKERSCRKDRI
jgi:hypothetical protein